MSPVPGVRLSDGERAAVQIVPAGTVVTEIAPSASRTRTTLAPSRAAAGRSCSATTSWWSRPGAAPTCTCRSTTPATPRSRSPRRPAPSARPGPPAGPLTPLRDTAAGLVVRQIDDRGWPTCGCSTRAPARPGGCSRSAASLVTVGPTSVAYVPPDCRGDCPLSVTGLADGRTRSYPLPAGHRQPRHRRVRPGRAPAGARRAGAVPGRPADRRARLRRGARPAHRRVRPGAGAGAPRPSGRPT